MKEARAAEGTSLFPRSGVSPRGTVLPPRPPPPAPRDASTDESFGAEESMATRNSSVMSTVRPFPRPALALTLSERPRNAHGAHFPR